MILISVQKKTVSKDALSVFGQNTTLVHSDDYNSSSCHYRICRAVIVLQQGENAGNNHSSGTL